MATVERREVSRTENKSTQLDCSPVTLGNSSVTKQNHDLMERLGILREVIPEHVGVFKMSLRVALLRVDEYGELGGVAEEEHRGVVVNMIPVALVGAELHGETTRVASCVGRSRLATNGGESSSCADLVANLREELSRADV